MTDTASNIVDLTRMTRQQRAALPLSTEVAQVIAEQHGVCIRPLAMRRIDTTTGRVDIVPVACGSTRADQCRPCADKARRLRMAQCRQGWHLDTEPVIERAKPSAEQQELMAARADLLLAYEQCRAAGDEDSCEQIADSVAELDDQLRALGVRGRLAPLDPAPKPVKRSTRRRHDAATLPRRPSERRTLGQVFAGRYRPSTFLTLTLDSYGKVDAHGSAIDPDTYDYRRAARTPSTSPPWWIGFGKTPAAASAGTRSTSAPSNPKNEAPRTSTPLSAAPSPGQSCAPSAPRPTTKSGGHPTTTSSTPSSGHPSGTPGPRPSPTPTPGRHCPPLTRPASS